ncbi:MAG: cobalt-precorrin-6A reductase [Rhodospirillales bacterium]|nr:cobalt-precorrin-6A reductase [Rhodospirillales bacterium]
MPALSSARRARAKRLLILGGTGEARRLADLADRRFGPRLDIVTSLAGLTEAPAAVAGTVRRGGFGGAAGLAQWLAEAGIDLLVDATHPFATAMSRQARAAASAAGVPRLSLVRPGWRQQPGDCWIEVADAAAAAHALRSLGRRVWLTLGGREVAAFASLTGKWFLVRRIDPPRAPLPLAEHALILGRGPFTLDGERRLIAEHRIEVVVAKASGGAATEAKLTAAREAGIPVVMIRRPPAEPGPSAATPEAALDWLAGLLDATDRGA